MPVIINVHGFASAGTGQKAQVLYDRFGDVATVISPSLPSRPRDAIKILTSYNQAFADGDEQVVWQGTSLGALYALHMALLAASIFDRHDRVLMINPSLNPSRTLRDKLGTVTNYKTNLTFDWKQYHLNELFGIEQSTENLYRRLRYDIDLFIALGKGDERLNFKNIRTLFPLAEIREYEGDHRFSTYEQVLDEDPALVRFLRGDNEWRSSPDETAPTA